MGEDKLAFPIEFDKLEGLGDHTEGEGAVKYTYDMPEFEHPDHYITEKERNKSIIDEDRTLDSKAIFDKINGTEKKEGEEGEDEDEEDPPELEVEDYMTREYYMPGYESKDDDRPMPPHIRYFKRYLDTIGDFEKHGYEKKDYAPDTSDFKPDTSGFAPDTSSYAPTAIETGFKPNRASMRPSGTKYGPEMSGYAPPEMSGYQPDAAAFRPEFTDYRGSFTGAQGALRPEIPVYSGQYGGMQSNFKPTVPEIGSYGVQGKFRPEVGSYRPAGGYSTSTSMGQGGYFSKPEGGFRPSW